MKIFHDKFCSLLKIKQIPPVIFPLYGILWALFFLFWSTRFGWKWLLGFWECYQCRNTYGPREEKHTYYTGYESSVSLCEGCKATNRLER